MLVKYYTRYSRQLSFTVLLSLSAFLNGCDLTPPSQAEDGTVNKSYNQTLTKFNAIKSMLPPTVPPSIVIVGVDQSGSMQRSRVAKIEYTDVEQVLKVVSSTGGTFAMSAICDRSDKPLTRVTFPEPTALDITTIPAPPQRPDTSKGSPFKGQKKLEIYHKEVKEYEKKLTEINQKLDTYQQQLNTKNQQNQQSINVLKPQIISILNQPRNCQNTDIQRSVDRATWLFAEPHTLSQNPRKYAVFITDGLDSFSNQAVNLQADKILLVNGSEKVGIFQTIPHQRFESSSQALNVLSQWMMK